MDACFVCGGGCSMDDSASGLATAMVAFLVANPALDDCFFCWGGGCSMDDSGSGLATAVVTFLVANPTMDVCFFWGGGCSKSQPRTMYEMYLFNKLNGSQHGLT